MATYRFIEDPATRQIHCFVQPAPTGELNAFRLRQAWDGSEFAGCHLFPERIEPALTDALNALAAPSRRTPAAPGEGAEEPPLASFVIAERQDAHCTVAVSDDGMNAEAAASAAQGGNALDDQGVRTALAAAGVRFGVDDPALATLVTDVAAALPGIMVRRMVARGRKPERGTPSRFENLVVPFQDRVLQPQERADGSIDFRDLGSIETVSDSSPLVRRHPARAGQSGMNVFGVELPSEVPAEVPIVVGDGTAIDPSDPHLLRSTRIGVPHRVPCGMSVADVLEVAAVDLHTGHVEFDGSLVVKGDVQPDMRVRVTKDLIVGGFIESADVEAGGDITAKKGIIGPPAMGATHNCRARGRSISTHYAQNSVLEASEDIVLNTHLVNCHVLGCRNLRVGGDRSKDARIVGGDVQARDSVATAIYGGEAGTATRISFDAEIQRLRQAIDSRHAHRAQLQETSAALENTLKELANKPRNEALNEKLARIANTIRAYREELQQMDADDAAKRQQIAALIAGCRVTARVRIHAGVELACSEARYRFGAERGGGTLGVRDGNWVGIEE
jgi:uncharacterized protein (DUF342 family)